MEKAHPPINKMIRQRPPLFHDDKNRKHFQRFNAIHLLSLKPPKHAYKML